MKRSSPVAGISTLAAILSLALPAFSQEEGASRPVGTSPERGNTVRIFITGNLQLDGVYRAHSVTAFTDSFSNFQGGAGTIPRAQTIAGAKSEDTVEGQWGVRFTAELSNRVTVVVEVGTLRVDGSPDPGAVNGNDQDGIRRFGLDTSPPIDLREAHLLIHDLFTPGFQVQIGITTWVFNPRGSGGSMAFDPRRSQTINRNLDSSGNFIDRDVAEDRLFEAGFVDQLQPVGGVMTYNRESFQIDIVLLPAVAEGGHTGNDESLYAVDLIYRLDALGLGKGSQVAVIVAQTSTRTVAPGSAGDTKGAQLWTFGTGGILKLADGMFEVFAEGYIQRGEVGRNANNGDAIKARGTAGVIGFQFNYTVGNPMPIWAGASFTHMSGDKDEDPTNHTADRFAGYESVNDLLVLEDPYFGYDWDSNIQVLKIWLGGRVSTFSKDDLEITAIVGFAETEERVFVPGGGTKDDLGNEIDIRFRWSMTKQSTLYLQGGFLWGSAILREVLDQGGNRDVTSNAQVVVLGMDISF
jgi:hypothetical protein